VREKKRAASVDGRQRPIANGRAVLIDPSIQSSGAGLIDYTHTHNKLYVLLSVLLVLVLFLFFFSIAIACPDVCDVRPTPFTRTVQYGTVFDLDLSICCLL
jgi:hypothetical protein